MGKKSLLQKLGECIRMGKPRGYSLGGDTVVDRRQGGYGLVYSSR